MLGKIRHKFSLGMICSLGLHLLIFSFFSTFSLTISTFSWHKKGTSLRISLVDKQSPQSSMINKNSKNKEQSLVSSKASSLAGINDKNALYVKGPMPIYPRPAKVRGIEGDVTLNIHINEKGIPYLIEITDSSGYSILDKAAIEGVKKWRFNPASSKGIKIASSIKKRFSFRLN